MLTNPSQFVGVVLFLVGCIFLAFLWRSYKKTVIAWKKIQDDADERIEELEDALFEQGTLLTTTKADFEETCKTNEHLQGKIKRFEKEIESDQEAWENERADLLKRVIPPENIEQMESDLQGLKLAREVIARLGMMALPGIKKHNLLQLGLMVKFANGVSARIVREQTEKQLKGTPEEQVALIKELDSTVKLFESVNDYCLKHTEILSAALYELEEAVRNYVDALEVYKTTGGPEPKFILAPEVLNGEFMKSAVKDAVKKLLGQDMRRKEVQRKVDTIVTAIAGNFAEVFRSLAVYFDSGRGDTSLCQVGAICIDILVEEVPNMLIFPITSRMTIEQKYLLTKDLPE